MPDDRTGKVADPDAAGQGGGSADPGKQADGDKMVPLTALEGAREELKTIKESNQSLQAQIDVYRANAANTQTQEQNNQLFSDLNDNDVVTVADVKKILTLQEQRLNQSTAQLSARQREPEYEKVIEKYLPGVLVQSPELAEAIRTSGNPVALALHLAKSSDAYRADKEAADLKAAGQDGNDPNNKGEGDQILENIQNKPGATSTGKGAGGGVSAVDKVLQMTDDELETRIQEVSSRA